MAAGDLELLTDLARQGDSKRAFGGDARSVPAKSGGSRTRSLVRSASTATCQGSPAAGEQRWAAGGARGKCTGNYTDAPNRTPCRRGRRARGAEARAGRRAASQQRRRAARWRRPRGLARGRLVAPLIRQRRPVPLQGARKHGAGTLLKAGLRAPGKNPAPQVARCRGLSQCFNEWSRYARSLLSVS